MIEWDWISSTVNPSKPVEGEQSWQKCIFSFSTPLKTLVMWMVASFRWHLEQSGMRGLVSLAGERRNCFFDAANAIGNEDWIAKSLRHPELVEGSVRLQRWFE